MPSSTTATVANAGPSVLPTDSFTASGLDDRTSWGVSICTTWVSSSGVTRVEPTPNARSGMNASLDSRCGSLTTNALTYTLGANAASLKLHVASPAAMSFHSDVTILSVSTVHRTFPRYGDRMCTVVSSPTLISLASTTFSWVGLAGRGV